VDPDGSVLVDAPPDFADDAVRQAVQKRARWVIDHVAEARSRHAHVRPREYVSGEQVLYLGRRYMLKVINVDTRPRMVRLKGNPAQQPVPQRDIPNADTLGLTTAMLVLKLIRVRGQRRPQRPVDRQHHLVERDRDRPRQPSSVLSCLDLHTR
jgi:hypothetical protein